MIRFLTNSTLFEPMLRDVLDYEIDYLSAYDGILYIPQDKKRLLELFILQMSSERNIQLTCLDCYGQDQLTYQCLLFADKMGSAQLVKMSTVLLLAMMRHDRKVLDEVDRFIEKLEPKQLEFSKSYILNEGNALESANHLFVHRNTINNWLNEFEKKTKMDLRVQHHRHCLELMLTYYHYDTK